MSRTMAVPCRRDLACFRNDGHPGECMYPTPETEPQPALARPTPEDFDKFTDDQFLAFTKAIGFDDRIKAAVAEVRAEHSSEAALADGLDVEVLAQALHLAAPDSHHRQKCRDRHDIRAANIAAQYARLLATLNDPVPAAVGSAPR